MEFKSKNNENNSTDSIHPICLPLIDDIKNRNFIGTHPFLAGWGATYYGNTNNSLLREKLNTCRIIEIFRRRT